MSIKTRTEADYRALELNSSSSLKDFSFDRKKYYKKYILREKIKEQPDKASTMGRLVETLLLEPERFDSLFFMSSAVKVPGGMLGDFIYKLSELVAKHSDDEGFDFEEIAREAYNFSGFKIKFETVLAKLDEPENKIYYEECLKVEHLNMTMVTAQDITNAEEIVISLKTCKQTSAVCTIESGMSPRFEVFNQMQIDGYEIDGMRLKSMIDKVIVDHQEKIINIYDLKCTWSVEGFYKDYYLYRRAYIQAYLYWKALEHLTKIPTNTLFNYTVNPPIFIVCDSINYYQPLLYPTSIGDMLEAYEGFVYKYTEYPGVKEIIENCKWAIENDIWDISKKNFELGGIINIKE